MTAVNCPYRIGKRQSFEAILLSIDATGDEINQEYVLVAGCIKELSSGRVFRDHCHIRVKRSVYEYLKTLKPNENFRFTALVYQYTRLIDIDWCSYRRVQLGLRGLILLARGG